MAIRVVVADDHPIVLRGIGDLFRREPDVKIVARCGDGVEAMEAIRRHRPSVVVLDLRMPRKDGLAVLEEMRAEGLEVPVVLLTAALDEDEVVEAIRLGARAVVLKETAPDTLVCSVRRVHAGEVCLDQRWMARALAAPRLRAERSRIDALTAREREISRLVVAGLCNKELAARLSITEGTVKIHLHNIYEKLGVDGRIELIVRAAALGVA